MDVEDLETARLGDDHPGIGDLAPGLGVERRRVEEEFAEAVVTDERRQHFGLHAVARHVASDEFGRTMTLDEVAVLRVIGQIQRLGFGTRAFALGAHRFVEGATIHAQPRFRNNLLGEFDREAVRVVQLEGHVAREYGRAARRHLSLGLFEQRKSGLQRSRETGFLAFQHLDDEIAVLDQYRIGEAHLLDGRVDQ